MISDYNNYIESIDTIFTSMLMKPLDIIFDTKTDKINMLTLYKHDDFGINVFTESVKRGKLSSKVVFIPYPFEIRQSETDKNVFYFDYRIERCIKGKENCKNISDSIKKTAENGSSLFFNSVVALSTTPND